jgi:hypothetical protein
MGNCPKEPGGPKGNARTAEKLHPWKENAFTRGNFSKE